MEKFRKFKSYHKFKRVVLTYIASQLSDSEIPDFGLVFKSIDENGDGVLTNDEMTKAFSVIFGGNTTEIEEIMKSIDTDGSGTLNYTEFIAATLEPSTFMSLDNLKIAFSMFDRDGSGLIQSEEMKEIVGDYVAFGDSNKVDWDELLKDVDVDGDGTIDFEEFVKMMERL